MLCDSIKEKELDNLKFSNVKANIKYDGERILAVKKDGEVMLVNRRGRNKTQNYLEVVKVLEKVGNDFILDGEMITFDDNFDKLQKRALTKDRFKQERLREVLPVKYAVFDILKLDQKDLKFLPLKERLKFIEMLELNSKNIEIAEYLPVRVMLATAYAEQREGIVIKNMESIYEERRSKNWLKCKFFKETTLVVKTYTTNNAGIRCEDSEGNAVQVSGSQHLAVKQLIDEQGEAEIEIQYLDKTKNGRLRFPSFRSLAK